MKKKYFRLRESSISKEDKKSIERGRGRGGFHGRGNKKRRGRGHFDGHDEQRQSNYDQKNYKSGIQCHYYKNFGHMKADC